MLTLSASRITHSEGAHLGQVHHSQKRNKNDIKKAAHKHTNVQIKMIFVNIIRTIITISGERKKDFQKAKPWNV